MDMYVEIRVKVRDVYKNRSAGYISKSQCAVVELFRAFYLATVNAGFPEPVAFRAGTSLHDITAMFQYCGGKVAEIWLVSNGELRIKRNYHTVSCGNASSCNYASLRETLRFYANASARRIKLRPRKLKQQQK